MKTLMLLLITMLFTACSAPMPGENVGETQNALCTGGGPPIATGTVGTMSTTPTLRAFSPWAGPPAEPYSAKVNTSARTSGKISWGAESGLVYKTTGCTGFDGPCGEWFGVPITSLNLQSWNDLGVMWVSFVVNGVKVAELVGANANTSLQNTKMYSGGVTRIRQDTGSNSRFYFEGWNAGVWTSWSAKFFNNCGSIN